MLDGRHCSRRWMRMSTAAPVTTDGSAPQTHHRGGNRHPSHRPVPARTTLRAMLPAPSTPNIPADQRHPWRCPRRGSRPLSLARREENQGRKTTTADGTPDTPIVRAEWSRMCRRPAWIGKSRGCREEARRPRVGMRWESNPGDRGQNHSWAPSHGRVPGDLGGGVQSRGRKSKALGAAPLCKTECSSVQSAASAARR